MFCDAMVNPGGIELLKNLNIAANQKNYPTFKMKRGSQTGKKIAIPNRTKEDINLLIEPKNPEYCQTKADTICIQPGHYGFIKVRFYIPENYTENKIKVSVLTYFGKTDQIFQNYVFHMQNRQIQTKFQ